MTRAFRDLPLLWKLLLPYVALVLVVGVADTFVVLRELASASQTSIDQDLTGRALDARSQLHDRELYVEEGAGFAADVQGMEAAVAASDTAGAGRLLTSVTTLKPRLSMVAVTNLRGVSVADRTADGGGFTAGEGTSFTEMAPVQAALHATDGQSRSGFVSYGSGQLLAVAQPICRAQGACQVVGVAVAGLALQPVLAGLAPGGGVALYSPGGELLAASGDRLPVGRPPAGGGLVRIDSGSQAMVYTPIDFQGRLAATLAVGESTSAAQAALRDAAVRMIAVLLAAMAGLALVGWLLARLLLAQLGPLLATSRALGAGDLSARAPVLAADEHGELAAVMNRMAEQLQASHQNLESQVAQRTAEVERLLRDRTQFFAGLSHELRTPLAVILTQAELLEQKASSGRNGKSPHGAATTISLSAGQVLDVVNRILDLARAEAGGVDVVLDDLSLEAVFNGIRPTLAGLCAGAGLEGEMLPTTLHVRADRRALPQALLNLVENAVKYTPAGGSVKVWAETEDDHVRIAVADTGVGIPAAEAARVFEPFYRVPGTATQQGQPASGLGLALTRKLIEAQGGMVGFEARPQGGTVFWTVLPLAAGIREEIRTEVLT